MRFSLLHRFFSFLPDGGDDGDDDGSGFSCLFEALMVSRLATVFLAALSTDPRSLTDGEMLLAPFLFLPPTPLLCRPPRRLEKERRTPPPVQLRLPAPASSATPAPPAAFVFVRRGDKFGSIRVLRRETRRYSSCVTSSSVALVAETSEMSSSTDKKALLLDATVTAAALFFLRYDGLEFMIAAAQNKIGGGKAARV